MRYTVRLIVMLLFSASTVSAQWRPVQPYFMRYYGLRTDSSMMVPRDTTGPVGDSALVGYKNRMLWVKTDTGWTKVGADIDTTSLSNRIDEKLNISDTTGKWIQNRTGTPQIADFYINGTGIAKNAFRADLPTNNSHFQIREANGDIRWGMGLINANSDWSLRHYDGVNVGSAITVNRTNGNVGVNDTAPSEKLHVKGAVRVVDGSQGSGKLFQSDSTGRGEWKYPTIIDVENFRYSTSTDWQVIDSAIRFAGPYSIIRLARNRVYTIDHAIVIKNNQELRGQGATLKRADAAVTTLSATMAAGTNSFTVTSVPSTWQEGDQIQIYTDVSDAKSSAVGPYITDISGTTITLSANIGNSVDGTVTTWPIGASVRTSYSIITSANFHAGGDIVRITGVRFDGNKANNSQSYSWQHNAAIAVRRLGSYIHDCVFYDSPNETITGHGFRVDDCQGYRLNGSFVHLSGLKNYGYSNKNAVITGCTTDSTNQITTTTTGHSEGVITTSFNGGWATVTNNRFYNGTNAVIGYIAPSNSVTYDDGVQDFVFTNNIARNFSRIVWQLIDAPNFGMTDSVRNVIITDNIFFNCGTTTNDWSSYSSFIGWYPSLSIWGNVLSGGTAWTLPVMPQKDPFIRNQRTLRWPGDFNMVGSGTIDSLNVGVATNDNASKLLVNGAARYYGDITRDNGIGIKRNLSDGPFTGLTEAQLTWGRPADASTSFGSLLIAPRGNTASTGVFFFTGQSSTLTERMRIEPDGDVRIGAANAATSRLDITGSSGCNQLRLRTTYTPTSSADSNGNTGDVSWDDNYIYIKTSAGWKRSALTAF